MNRPDDHEAKMARADLFKLAQYSFKLFKMIQENQELEGWVQAKVTKAADYISSVYHYMQYEMKVSEYGDHLENAEMYSESVRRAFEQKLAETRNKALKAKMLALRESVNKDDYEYYFGKDKPSSGGSKTRELSKHTATKTGSGTQYTKRDLPGQDTADDADEKRMKRQARKDRKKTDEDASAPPPKGPDGQYPVITSGPNKGKRWTPQAPGPTLPPAGAKTPPPGVQPPGGPGFTPEKAKLDPRYKTDPAFKREVDMALQIGNKKMQEALKGKQTKLDVDKDGKLEKSDFAKLRSGKSVKEAAKPDFLDMDKDGNKKEPMKKAVADKKKGAVKEASGKCNHTPKGKSCPVHGLKECGGMYEGAMSDLDADRKDRAYQTRQAKTTMKHVKDPTPGEKKAAKDIKPGIKGYSDRVAMLKSAEKDGRLKEAHSAKQQAAIAIAKKAKK